MSKNRFDPQAKNRYETWTCFDNDVFVIWNSVSRWGECHTITEYGINYNYRTFTCLEWLLNSGYKLKECHKKQLKNFY